jgi:hypothetical protein
VLGNSTTKIIWELGVSLIPFQLLICIFIHVWCDINFSFALCLFVLRRVEELVAEDPNVQQAEVVEQELIEGKLCP